MAGGLVNGRWVLIDGCDGCDCSTLDQSACTAVDLHPCLLSGAGCRWSTILRGVWS